MGLAVRPRGLGAGCSSFGTAFGACFLGFGVDAAELGNVAFLEGGLTGSKAGLWGAAYTWPGPGVDGVD